MIYSEKQLDSFSNPPFKYETQQVIKTKDLIQEALKKNIPNVTIQEKFQLDSFKYDIYLKGSYKNSTNITKSSDVDIVIELTSVFYPDTSLLVEAQKAKYEAQKSTTLYKYAEFKNDIQAALVKSFGNTIIKRGNKSLKFIENGTYCNADVIPCYTHKKFTFFESYSNSRLTEGIEFYSDAGEKIINYPHQHYDNLVKKSEETSGNYKATVRMFKNLRDKLIENKIIGDGVAKSYYIENLLYNVDSKLFSGDYSDRFKKVLGQLVTDFNNNSIDNYKCANGIHKLIADNTWSKESARQFLTGLTKIRDQNEF
jgi:hypothetical protein